ncbi:MAG: DegT/DnrJ/EryC1/StrS family aminotransferase [Candidatus Pacearchaeota archaeon]|jgi:dTDP-4-amino-4,6-dideoxygalactose transaminase
MKRINWYEPNFDKDDEKAIIDVLRRGYINEGPKTKELEEKIKELLNVPYVLLTTNGTSALFLGIKAEAMKRKKGYFEVIVPDMTMIATANAVEAAGGTPILSDVEIDDFRMTMNLENLEKKVTKYTIGIVPVHTLGRSAISKELLNFCKEKNLFIVEDAANALGSKHDLKKDLGTFGDIGCYSLQANKIITCGQGGIIVTSNEESYGIMRRLRDFGRNNNKEFLHSEIGYNFKFNDLQAALTLSQLNKLEKRKEMLTSQLIQYIQGLDSLIKKGKIKFPEVRIEKGEVPLWIDVFAESRNNLIQFLNSNEIYPRICWPALHQNPPYQNQGNDEKFPNSAFFANNFLWLPNGPAIKEEDINLIINKIKEFYKTK